MADGILYIDGFNWADLKSSGGDTERRALEERTFSAYHSLVRECIEIHGGSVWNTIGDATIACGFPNIDEAAAAAMLVQERLFQFNCDVNELNAQMIVRVGLSRGNLPDIPKERRPEEGLQELDEVGHLQKSCPPGRIRISKAAFDKLRFRRHNFRPSLAFNPKSKIGDSLISIQRTLVKEELIHLHKLSRYQRDAYPLIAAAREHYLTQPYKQDFSNISEILSNAVIILGETRRPAAHDVAVSHSSSTSDAIGILDIMAALASASQIASGIDEWVDTGDLAAQANIVIVGSPANNIYAYAANTISLAGFEYQPGVPVRIRVPEDGRIRFFPEGTVYSELDRCIGLVLLTRNPLNPQYHMLWIAGITGIATQAAARFVRDLVLNPNSTLDKWNSGKNLKPNAAVIMPRWREGYEMQHYHDGRWRVTDYTMVWSGRA
jgi:hypothetical protein